MSLVTCKDCGKEISTEARACVHCGCPSEIYVAKIKKKRKQSLIIKLSVWGVLLVALIIFIVSGGLMWLLDHFVNWYTSSGLNDYNLNSP